MPEVAAISADALLLVELVRDPELGSGYVGARHQSLSSDLVVGDSIEEIRRHFDARASSRCLRCRGGVPAALLERGEFLRRREQDHDVVAAQAEGETGAG